MNKVIIKSVIAGVLIGSAVFFAPFFVIKMLLFLFILGLIFRVMFWRSIYRFANPMMHVAYADKVRNMSEEEYNEFKNQMNHMHMQRCYRDYPTHHQIKKNENE